MVADAGKTVFELKAGDEAAADSLTGLTVQVGSAVTVSAKKVLVRYATSGTGVAVAQNQVLAVGGTEYRFDEAINYGTVAFGLRGMVLDVAGYVTLTGNVGISKVGTQIVATGSGLTARLEAS